MYGNLSSPKLQQALERCQQNIAALEHSESRLREITDAIPAHIAYFDHTWTYRYVNRAYARWFGHDEAAKMIDRRIIEVVPLEVFDAVRADMTRALEGENLTYEYTMSAPGGVTLHARSTLVPDIGPDGEVFGVYIHAVDITEQRRTQEALIRAQKLETIGQLTGGLAHDFNNMLTVVMGNLASLREARPNDTVAAEFIDPALQAASRGAELIRRLLTLSRQHPLSPRVLDLNHLVQDMSRLIRRSVPESIAIRIDCCESGPCTRVDPHQLENALLNLVLNARDAMPEGGTLQISTRHEWLDATQAARLDVSPGPYVRLSVEDNGSGMDADTLERVFEPFFTTKGIGFGSGLGLAMVQGFLRQSGGAIHMESQPGHGTRASLYLPGSAQMCADAAPSTTATPPHSRPGLAGHLVLLVEDDAEVRKIVRMQLASFGAAVIEAESGDEAADLVENIDRISLVISDIVMPGSLDGVRLARFIEGFRPGLPVVLMTGYADQGGTPLEAGRCPLLEKPFTREHLASLIATLGLPEAVHPASSFMEPHLVHVPQSPDSRR